MDVSVMEKMSDLRRESARFVSRSIIRGQVNALRAGVNGHDLTLEAIRVRLVARGVHLSHRQIQRCVVSGVVPGAYRLKQGRGHWRVRVCDALALWILEKQCAPVAAKIGDLLEWSTPLLDRVQLSRKWSLRDFTREDSLRRLKTKALQDLPAGFVRRCRKNKDALRVGLLARELTDSGVKPGQLTAAVYQAMQLSRATFYRRGYGKFLALFRAPNR